MDSGDLLRQLVYLPQASIFIAEARREVVGGAVLALRPSVRAGGFVGAVDLIVVDPDHDADRVTDALLEEILRSARNKGCSVVEAALSDDPAERTRLERHGFVESGPRAECRVATVGCQPRSTQHELIRGRQAARVAPASLEPGQGVKVGKNVAVFVDVANIFYAAKAAGTDIDYVTLLKAATAGRDFVRAYAYTGLDPDNENQRNFHAFLARNHYKVVSKDIRKYGDGKVKANLDIELVVDMMKTARNLDIAIVVSGDGDFAPAIRAVQEMGVRVEVISFRGNTSSRPDRGRGPLHRHHPAGAGRQDVVALGPAGRRRRRGPVDDRGPGQADRGHRRSAAAAAAAAAAGPARPSRSRPRRTAPSAAVGRRPRQPRPLRRRRPAAAADDRPARREAVPRRRAAGGRRGATRRRRAR